MVDWSEATNVIPHLVDGGEAMDIVQDGHHPTLFVPDEKRAQIAFAGFVAVRDCLHAGS